MSWDSMSGLEIKDYKFVLSSSTGFSTILMLFQIQFLQLTGQFWTPSATNLLFHRVWCWQQINIQEILFPNNSILPLLAQSLFFQSPLNLCNLQMLEISIQSPRFLFRNYFSFQRFLCFILYCSLVNILKQMTLFN